MNNKELRISIECCKSEDKSPWEVIDYEFLRLSMKRCITRPTGLHVRVYLSTLIDPHRPEEALDDQSKICVFQKQDSLGYRINHGIHSRDQVMFQGLTQH